jgi:hypothetical protein
VGVGNPWSGKGKFMTAASNMEKKLGGKHLTVNAEALPAH